MLNIVNYNNKTYKIIGNIQINNSTFSVGENSNQIIMFNTTNQTGEINDYKKDPSKVEYAFISFLQQQLQLRIDNGFIKEELSIVIANINGYIQTNLPFIKDIAKIKDEQVNSQNMAFLFNFFNNAMANNQYFKKQEVEGNTIYPDYDEQVVTMILSSKQQENFDLDNFITKYFNYFTKEQIKLLLKNFNLNMQQLSLLNKRKETLNSDTEKSSKLGSRGKTKTFALPGIKESKEAAFVDTLLLSFTVGIFCGIYLMYLILTIMS